MLTAVYKSTKKENTYLFVEKRDDFSRVPEPLKQLFGPPQLVIMLKLTPEKVLGTASAATVIDALTSVGFYLQLPPPDEDLLINHKINAACY